MRAIKLFVLSTVLVFATSCKQDEASPDPEAISDDYCSIVQMCNFADFELAYGDFDGCKADILMDFDEAKDISDECFDATVDHLACVGAYESCEEYDKPPIECQHKFNDYYGLCLGGL